MGLDITVMERKDVRCPHCGEVVNTVDIASTDSGGRAWYEFLENIGYCVPYGKRTEEKDWNCLDMVLDNEQARKRSTTGTVWKELWQQHLCTRTRWSSTPTGS